MKILNPLRYLFRPVVSEKPSCQKPLPARKDSELRQKILHRLISTGRIDVNTIQRFGTNRASAYVSDLRKEGLLFAADDPQGFEWKPNAKGNGQHKVYNWTNKLPPEWVKTDTYVGRNRRKHPRGQN